MANPTLRCATRDVNGAWAFFYSTKGDTIQVVMNKLATGTADAQWMDPRTGAYQAGPQDIPSGSGAANYTFDPPGAAGTGNDWVLVLDVD